MKETKNSTLKWLLGAFSFLLFAAGIVATVSLTIGTIDILLPGNVVMKTIAPVFLDIGFVLWASLAIWKSRSTPQWAAALVLAVVDFAGMALMIVFQFYYGGQTLVTPPPNLASLAIWGTSVVILANVASFFYFEGNTPELIQARQEWRQENAQFEANLKYQGELFDKAMRVNRSMLDRMGFEMAEIIARRNFITLRNQLDLKLTKAERKALEEDAIESKFVEVDPVALLAPANTPGVGAKLGAWLAGMARFFGTVREGYMSFNSTSQPLPRSSSENNQDQEPNA